MKYQRRFVRQLVLKTVCDVTGEDPDEILEADPLKVDVRDWEQILSRLEAYFDCTLDRLTAARHVVDIEALTDRIRERTA